MQNDIGDIFMCVKKEGLYDFHKFAQAIKEVCAAKGWTRKQIAKMEYLAPH